MPQNFWENSWSYVTWKLDDFIDPLSQQQAQANDPHKELKYCSKYKVLISFYVIKKFRLATELEP